MKLLYFIFNYLAVMVIDKLAQVGLYKPIFDIFLWVEVKV